MRAFLSHSSKDKPFVTQVANVLEPRIRGRYPQLFTRISHQWLRKMVAHRIANRRFLSSLQMA
jgi:hypothetical protein